MASVVRFHRTGGPEVLQLEQMDIGPPGPGEVRVRHVAVGLNFNDVYYRSGMYPSALPSLIGREGAGVIEEVGSGVEGFAAGDRVTYTTSPLGAYSSERNIQARLLYKIPDAIGFETAAAMTMRGLTAAYLVRRMRSWLPGDSLLIHAAAGGVGLIVCQWAKLLGLTVIGTVSSPGKLPIAQAHGCDHVIVRGTENVPQRVRELTGGQGVPVVFDGVGRDTYEDSLDSLGRRGLLVGFGTASGAFPPIDATSLARRGSLFFTRPALADYTATPGDRQELSAELFGHVAAGRIRIEIGQKYPLAEAAHAHREFEKGTSTGSSILLI